MRIDRTQGRGKTGETSASWVLNTQIIKSSRVRLEGMRRQNPSGVENKVDLAQAAFGFATCSAVRSKGSRRGTERDMEPGSERGRGQTGYLSVGL